MEYNEYVLFILGYDAGIVRGILEFEPCDKAYEICKNIAIAFELSEEKKDLELSLYDALRKFVDSKFVNGALEL